MEDEAVDLDFKLKQFLADVHKFSKRYEEKQKERSGDPQTSNQNKKKTGLFENITSNNLNVKGIFGYKAKARLTGNLELLTGRKDNEYQITSTGESSEENTVWLNERKVSSKNKKGTAFDSELGFKKVDSIESDDDFKFKKDFLKEIDIFIKFSEKRAQECVAELKVKAKNIPKDSRDDALFKFHSTLMNLLHERMLKNALLDEDGLIKRFKSLCQEYIKSQKTNMVDKYVQTENCYFESSNNQGFLPPDNSLYLDLINKGVEEPFSFNPGNQIDYNNSIYREKENSIETPQVFKTKCVSTVQDDGKPYIPIILSPLSPGRKYPSISSPAISNFNHHLKDSKLQFSANKSLFKNEVFNNFLKPKKSHPLNFMPASPPLQIPYDFHPNNAKGKELFCDQEFRLSPLEEDKIHCNNFIPTVSRNGFSDNFNDFPEVSNMGMTSAYNNFSSSKKIKLMFSPHKL